MKGKMMRISISDAPTEGSSITLRFHMNPKSHLPKSIPYISLVALFNIIAAQE